MYTKTIKVILLAAFLCSNQFGYSSQEPKNIILMIGDGMGIAQIYAGMTANHGHLNMERCKYIGLVKTYSYNNYITDSGAAGTAISSGNKTINDAVGVNPDTIPVKTILEYAEENELSTGLVTTYYITDATPAAFIAHQADRYDYENVALDFLNTDIDVFIGGGRNHFNKRSDKRDLVKELEEKGYNVIFNMEDLIKVKCGKLAGLVDTLNLPSYSQGRGNMLTNASLTAINILNQNKKGFFLMIELEHTDDEGHNNNSEKLQEEVLDFDRTVGKVLDFAEKDKETLVIIMADHETGGASIINGDIKEGKVEMVFSTKNHTGVFVPVLAYGPMAENFCGIYENTEIFKKMMSAFGFSKISQ